MQGSDRGQGEDQVRERLWVTSCCPVGDAGSSPASASARDSALGYWLPIAMSSRIGVSAICDEVEQQVSARRESMITSECTLKCTGEWSKF